MINLIIFLQIFLIQGQWKTIDIKLRDLLVENGPIRVDYLNFPIDKNSRHFSSMHYIWKLSNGEKNKF